MLHYASICFTITMLWYAPLCFAMFHCASLCFMVVHYILYISMLYALVCILHDASSYPTMLCYVLQCFTVLHYAPLCLPMLHCSLLFFTDFTFKKSARVKCTCKCVFLCLQYHICKTLYANFRGITHFCISLALFTVLVSTCSVRKL